MQAPGKELRLWFSKEIHGAILKSYPDCAITLEQVSNSITKPKKEYGDLSCSISLRISKQAAKKPAEVAEQLLKNIGKNPLVLEVNEFGGYINAKINEKAYSKAVFEAIEKAGDDYAKSSMGKKEKVLLESPAVNPNKPWHIGHLRNALLGDTIANLLDYAGYSVEREDYIDDLGLQMAQSVWGFQNIGSKPDKKFDQWIGEQYVEVNKMIKEKKLDIEMSNLLKEMESGSGKNAQLARELASKVVSAQYETGYAYGITHDVMIWESDIVKAKLLEKALEIALKKGALERRSEGKNAGCIVMDINKVRDLAKDFENPEESEKVIVRSDGTATYVAKDLAFHMWKLGILGADFKYSVFGNHNGKKLYTTGNSGEKMGFGKARIVVNVIGSAQRYPQLILKALLSLAGYAQESSRIVHIAYGEVSVEGGSLSGRQGGWMAEGEKAFTADSLLFEAIAKAKKETVESTKITDKSRVDEISSAIGRSAIRFEFLRVSPAKTVVFSWKSALNFEGNSGPYCMYTYARSNRILERAQYKKEKIGEINFDAITRGNDFELIKLLGEAQNVVEKAANEYSPNLITDYIVELTSAFSTFYESMPVIKSGEAQSARMRLIDSYMQVLKNMFGIIGMDAVSSM